MQASISARPHGPRLPHIASAIAGRARTGGLVWTHLFGALAATEAAIAAGHAVRRSSEEPREAPHRRQRFLSQLHFIRAALIDPQPPLQPLQPLPPLPQLAARTAFADHGRAPQGVNHAT